MFYFMHILLALSLNQTLRCTTGCILRCKNVSESNAGFWPCGGDHHTVRVSKYVY